MEKPKILLFDIETMAKLGFVWGNYEQNVIATHRHGYLLTVAWKWYGEKKVNVASLPDFPTYKKDKFDDKALTKLLWDLFDEADVIIAHNGNSFDIKKANASFVRHGFNPPSPYKTVDTRLVAKRYFRFDSNKLDDLGDFLGVGRKQSTGGFDLWLGCESGDESAWRKMCLYNKQDVVLLENVYDKLKPFMTNHPNLNLLLGTTHSCPNCGSVHLQSRGAAYTRTTVCKRYQCKECGAWSQGNTIAR